MKWPNASQQISRLVGRPLRSISGKSNIRLVRFDGLHYEVERSDKVRVKRSVGELRRLVTALAKRRPVHVDSFFKGSGSSRSHPETILANTPEVEWCMVESRKHLKWVGRATHPPGTLKKSI